MNIHEYQAKIILSGFNIPTLKGHLALNIEEAIKASKSLIDEKSGKPVVVKAQVHAGGRGKGGGIKVSKTLADVEKAAAGLFNTQLVTPQTGPAGKPVQKLYIEEGVNIQKEFYLSLLLDRSLSQLSFILSSEGGMDIEEVAKSMPNAIHRVVVPTDMGLRPFHVRNLVDPLGLDASQHKKFSALIENIYKAYTTLDMSLLEINPLVLTKEGDLFILDAKVGFDDNALYRHPDIAALRDEAQEDPIEVEATKCGLNYIKLDGSIGCMVNGAGLAMASMDMIKLCGGSPANFLDVGGGASEEMVSEAFRLILSDTAVKGILVNIFGGIMRCDIIAHGIINAAKTHKIKVPVVVRLAGTNVAEGQEILAKSGLQLIPVDTLAQAGEKIVEVTRQTA